MAIKNVDLQAIIDTIEIKIEFSNIDDLTLDYTEYPFIGDKPPKDNINKQHRIIVMNLNKKTTRYNRITKLSKFNEVYNEIMKLITVLDQEQIKKTRIDIAIDCDLDFNDNYKFFLFLHRLLAYDDKGASNWSSEDLDRMIKKQLYAKSKKLIGTGTDVVIYDKSLESEGKHYAKTRIEFRCKELGKARQGTKESIENIIKKIIKQISNIEENIEALEMNTARMLVSKWNERKAENPQLTLAKFVSEVSMYSNYIYTTNIMRMLYQGTGLRGSYSKWIEKARKTTIIEVYTKSDIVKFKKGIMKAMKIYIKN